MDRVGGTRGQPNRSSVGSQSVAGHLVVVDRAHSTLWQWSQDTQHFVAVDPGPSALCGSGPGTLIVRWSGPLVIGQLALIKRIKSYCPISPLPGQH